MVTSSAITQTFSIAPTFLRFANRRQFLIKQGTAKSQCFLIEVMLQPMVADAIDVDEINGFSNAALGSSFEIGISANGLNDHAVDFEALFLEKQAIVVELNSPIEGIFHSVITKLFTEFR